MSKKILVLLVLLIQMGLGIGLQAQPKLVEDLFEESYTYKKIFSLKNIDLVKIKNEFGKVTVVNSDKNEVEIQVNVLVKSSNASRAKSTIEAISINEKNSDDEIYVFTKIAENQNNYNSKNESNEMRIDYEIKIPKNSKMKITNSFGAIEMKEHTGNLQLISKFGKINADDLSNVENLEIEFGKLEIEKLLVNQFSAKFSDINIGELNGIFNGSFEYCGNSDIAFGKEMEQIKMKVSYSTINIKVPDNFDASLTAKMSYGSLNNFSKMDIEKIYDNNYSNSNTYSGKSGYGKYKFEIKSDYSTIKLK